MPRRIALVTSDARVRPPEEDDAVFGAAALSDEPRAAAQAAAGERSRLSLPLVPVLATLLVLLVAAAAFLWFTRPEPSAIGTGDYVEALQAARSGVVDLTSFDHITLDDDIEQIRRVTTGDLREESVAELEDNRDQLVESEAIVNTEVVGAGVTRAGSDAATVLMVIQATQQSTASPQAQVVRYRIQVELMKENDRWVLSGITGR
jgi:Mce-associated membrane protein